MMSRDSKLLPKTIFLVVMLALLVASTSCIIKFTTRYQASDYTPIYSSDGELCEIEEADGTIVRGDHDDFSVHADILLKSLTEDDTTPSAENQELIDYIRDCIATIEH